MVIGVERSRSLSRFGVRASVLPDQRFAGMSRLPLKGLRNVPPAIEFEFAAAAG
jgi:hypothetical protein